MGWVYSMAFSADERELVALHETAERDNRGGALRRRQWCPGRYGRTVLVGPVVETDQEAPDGARDARRARRRDAHRRAGRDPRRPHAGRAAHVRRRLDRPHRPQPRRPDAAARAQGRPDPLRRPRLGRRAARVGPPPGRGPAARLHPRWTHGRERGSRQPDPALGRRAADDPGDARRPLRAHHRAGRQPRRADALQQRARRQDHALGPQRRAPARPSVRAPATRPPAQR